MSTFSYGAGTNAGSEPDLPDRMMDLDVLGPSLLVGAGAIGSGVAFGLACLPKLHGRLHVVDDDIIDRTNLERHLVSTSLHLGTAKVRRIAELFGNGTWNGLIIRPHETTYGALEHQRWRTVVAAVDTP